MSAPERIWVQWPHFNGAGLAFSCNARPQAKRTEYVRADRIAALEAEVARLRGLVFVAYHEGYTEAGGHWRSDSGWEKSEARAALEGETP